jgi:serine/threonine protein phosphatase PrpC
MSLEYATGLDVGARKRTEGRINEDSVAVNVLEDGHLDTGRSAAVFVLADGAGGEEAGEVASYVATVEVTRRLTELLWDSRTLDSVSGAGKHVLDRESVSPPLADREPEWVANRIETAIRSTHTRILQRIGDLGLGSAYTTIVVGVKIGDRLHYGWVGDSRAYVVNRHPDRAARRRLSLLTRDHSVVERLRERGEIDDVEAHVHRQGNRITRALGGTAGDDPAGSTVQIETGHVRLFGDDVVLFTSDGLIDAYADAPTLHDRYRQADDTAAIEAEIRDKSVTDDEIRDVICDAGSLPAAVDRFLALANSRGGKDNLSLILARDAGLDRSPAGGFPDRSYDGDVEPLDTRDTVIRDGEREGE